ncbi:hypothetical protein ANACOL_01273 [Anaerotruncus colihominis DSM 17241]|uniref:Uncharacterized protein n=1 Tax=Anaerotruncus colihominis DSM 17241 TaxID=445972 RepID=B0P927_9FIRM|nr:hypothetical protein ANACOL_01273 [Anaerotruncus colihominis DSM 17241]
MGAPKRPFFQKRPGKIPGLFCTSTAGNSELNPAGRTGSNEGILKPCQHPICPLLIIYPNYLNFNLNINLKFNCIYSL